MTREEARQHLADVKAGRKPERELDIPDFDGTTAVRLMLWHDGRITWR